MAEWGGLSTRGGVVGVEGDAYLHLYLYIFQ